MKKFFPAMNFTICRRQKQSNSRQTTFLHFILCICLKFFCSLFIIGDNEEAFYQFTFVFMYLTFFKQYKLQIIQLGYVLPFPIFCRFRVCALDDDVVAASVLNAEHRRLHVVDATAEQLDPIHQNLKVKVNKIITVSILQTLHFFSYHKLAFKFKNYKHFKNELKKIFG